MNPFSKIARSAKSLHPSLEHHDDGSVDGECVEAVRGLENASQAAGVVGRIGGQGRLEGAAHVL